jgi:hypothetical protein
MDPVEAAERLDRMLRGKRWYVSVGVGKRDGRPTLFVYVTSKSAAKAEKLSSAFEGFPVIAQSMRGLRVLGP